ncbi:MAG TPA: TRAP transporter small permease subunit [Dehalococcoidia bacterium]|jgi:TRAP-type mannitol/chloroaromatic compound transport system permease small subunit|nr:TRAP transporter small permease subunit [Dehalococcoidia bacterium]
MAIIRRILHGIDFVCIWAGKLSAFLVIPLILAVVYEVVSRYGFDAPTIWAFEIERMLGGTMFVMGLAWVLLMRAHVRVDLFYQRWSPRGQAILDAVLTLLIVFPLWAVVLPDMAEFAIKSWAIHEQSSDSAWRNIIYPFKTVMPVAFTLLLLALVTTFIRDIETIIRGKRC